MRFVVVMEILAVFGGCGASVPVLPECGSTETLDLVGEIVRRDLDVSPEGFSIELVEAKAGMMGDEERDAYTCSAYLTLEETDEQASTQKLITYTVDRSATAPTSFVINVYNSLPLPLGVSGRHHGSRAIGK